MPTDFKSKSLTENKKPEKDGILSFPGFYAVPCVIRACVA